MKEISSGRFYASLYSKKVYLPLNGHLELTYRCNLDCIHCYCKQSEDKYLELNTFHWKKILNQIHKYGCIKLIFSGGEPLIREDFLDIYSYAKKKGFLIKIFTNGRALNGKILDYLAKSPPFSIEITLNGITKGTYESVTGVSGSFSEVMANIKGIKEKKLPLILKSNCLKQNKHEIAKIKAFTDKFLGKKKAKFNFKYDPMIYPRLNGDKASINYRLSFKELLELRETDADIWQEYRKRLKRGVPSVTRERRFLYRCSSWRENFFINPYGRLKFCQFSDKFSTDLKTGTFQDGFYNTFPKLLDEEFKTDSRCKDCRLRTICYHCPGRAYLETGSEEAPVPYYCALAKQADAEKNR